MIQKNNLPKGWVTSEIGEVLNTIRGISFPKDAKKFNYEDGLIVCLRTANVQKQVDWKDLWFVNKSYLRRDEQIIQKGDILISIANSLELLGKVSLVNKVEYESTLGTFIGNIRVPKQLNNKFFYYYFLSQKFREEVRRNASTTTNISNISVGKLEKLNLLVAPLPEQHRIVAKIEELFSELDNGVENLKKAQQELKVYRQAVLKYAFEGKLTEEWRKQHSIEPADKLLAKIKEEREKHYQQQLKDWQQAVIAWDAQGRKGKKPAKLKKPKELPPLTEVELANLPKLPEEWKWILFGEFLTGINAGKSFKCEERPPKENEYGVAKVSAVTWGIYNEEESKTCIDQDKINDEYLINEGDFLFSRANTIELVGACVLVHKIKRKVMLSDKTL